MEEEGDEDEGNEGKAAEHIDDKKWEEADHGDRVIDREEAFGERVRVGLPSCAGSVMMTVHLWLLLHVGWLRRLGPPR